MQTMIDFYRSRYGELVKGGESATSLNGPCPFCNGGTDRFVIWTDRDGGLGKTCAEHGIRGVFWCRQCGMTGDSIEYLMKAEGLDFKAACAELGIGLRNHDEFRKAPQEKKKKATFEGRKLEAPEELWKAHVERMTETAARAIRGSIRARAWLAERGITGAMIERYELGLLEGENGRTCRFRARGSFGLPPKIENGKAKKLWIPRGITIPSRQNGEITMFRIRRPNGDLQVRVERDHTGAEREVKDEKYWELSGGSKASYHLPPTTAGSVKVYAVVEAEFDAMLLHAVSGETIGTVALRNASNKPDVVTHAALAASDLILLTLDTDSAGACAIAWWMDHYPQAKPYPIPGFKDPGDALKGGFDLRLWLESGVPMSVRLAPSKADAVVTPPSDGVSVEASSGSDFMGVEGNDDPEKEDDFLAAQAVLKDGFEDLLTLENLKGLRAALPSYLDIEAVPREVLALAVLWSGAPIHYHKMPTGGFEWVVANSWPQRNLGHYDRFMKLATRSAMVRDWLDTHVAEDISGRNFLKLLGDV